MIGLINPSRIMPPGHPATRTGAGDMDSSSNAKMGSLKTDDNLLLLKINMGGGHGGRSGRYDRLYGVAEEYACILAAMWLAE